MRDKECSHISPVVRETSVNVSNTPGLWLRSPLADEVLLQLWGRSQWGLYHNLTRALPLERNSSYWGDRKSRRPADPCESGFPHTSFLGGMSDSTKKLCAILAMSPSDSKLPFSFPFLNTSRFSSTFSVRPKMLVHYITVRRKEFSRLEVMSAVGLYGTCIDNSGKIEFICCEDSYEWKIPGLLITALCPAGRSGARIASILLSHWTFPFKHTPSPSLPSTHTFMGC